MKGVLLCLVLLAGVSGCEWGVTDLARVAADPFRYQARTLTVSGTVSWSGHLPEVGRHGFELEKGPARLLVLSDRPAPARGTRIKVAGTIEAEFDLGDRHGPVLLDEDPGPKKNGGAADVR